MVSVPQADDLHSVKVQPASLEQRITGERTIEFDLPPGSEGKLIEWWLQKTYEDAQATLPKAREYGGTDTGSADLQIMGFALSKLRMPEGTPEAVQQEVACWFYALGKVARLITDYNDGRPGKPDSWHDMGVYATMAERLQTTGRWP